MSVTEEVLRILCKYIYSVCINAKFSTVTSSCFTEFIIIILKSEYNSKIMKLSWQEVNYGDYKVSQLPDLTERLQKGQYRLIQQHIADPLA